MSPWVAVGVEITPQPNIVVKGVCYALNLKEKEVLSKSRKPELVEARMIISYVLSTRYNFGCTRISRIFGKNHATVINNLKKFKSLLEIGDKQIINKLNEVYKIQPKWKI